MSQVSAPVTCPQCQATYRWRDEFVGRELACRCGATFQVAAQTAAAASQTTRLPPAALMGRGKSPIEEALEKREDEVQPSRVRDLLVPTILLPVGVVAQFVLWTRLAGDIPGGAVLFAGAFALQLVLFAPLMFAAVVTTARWFEVALGNLATVLLKMAALTFAMAGVGDVLFTQIMVGMDFDYWCLVAGYGVYLVLCGLPAMYLLEMGVAEGALVVLFVFLPRVMAIYTAALAFPGAFS